MRIWDVHPGYLNNQSLLGEHRELHGIFSIIQNKKRGYSRHPETLRWVSKLRALSVRHELLVAEMALRGFRHHSPIEMEGAGARGNVPVPIWPSEYIDEPVEQFQILKQKYLGKKKGRIPLPEKTHQLWAGHKYSVMARDPQVYKEIGPWVSAEEISFEELATMMVDVLKTPPGSGRLANAVLHMWGYVSKYSSTRPDDVSLTLLMQEIQSLVNLNEVVYLMHSTALSELQYWISLQDL